MKSKKEYLIKNKERKEENMNNSKRNVKIASLISLFIVMIISVLAYSLYYLKVDISLTPTEEKYAYESSSRAGGRFGSEIDPLTLKDDIVVSSGAGGNGTLWMPLVHQDLGGNGRTDLLCGTWRHYFIFCII